MIPTRSLVVLTAAFTMLLTEPCQSQTSYPTKPPPAAGAPTASAAPTASGAPTAPGLKVVAKFSGVAPANPPLRREADPFCAKTKMNDETVLVNPNGTLKNVAVRIAKASAPLPALNPPPAEVVLDQQNCMYRPRVLGVVTGQKVLLRNSDPTLHNVHAYSGTATLFNRAMMKGAKDIEQVFNTAGPQKFKCDVHPWMTSYVVVNDNPFIAVTGDTGEVDFANLPAGTYTLELWHEKYGSKTAEVAVAAGQTSRTEITFAAQ